MSHAITGRISRVKRLRNSYFGNPRYEITLVNNGTYRTAADHSFVYAGIPLHGVVTLTIGGRGTIVGLVHDSLS